MCEDGLTMMARPGRPQERSAAAGDKGAAGITKDRGRGWVGTLGFFNNLSGIHKASPLITSAS